MSFHCSFAVSLGGRRSHSPSAQCPLCELSVCPIWKVDVCAAASLHPGPCLCPSTFPAVPGPRLPLAGRTPQTSPLLSLPWMRGGGLVGWAVVRVSAGGRHGRERLCLPGPPCRSWATDSCMLVIPGPLPSSLMALVRPDEEVEGGSPQGAALGVPSPPPAYHGLFWNFSPVGRRKGPSQSVSPTDSGSSAHRGWYMGFFKGFFLL